MLQFGITSEFVYVVTNQSFTWFNMKFRKFKNNNFRNTNKTRQLKQEVLELSSMGIHTGLQRRDREQNICGNKTNITC